MGAMGVGHGQLQGWCLYLSPPFPIPVPRVQVTGPKQDFLPEGLSHICGEPPV